jgi:uncharacterized protein
VFELAKHQAVRLKRSRFGHFFERDGVACFYHSLKILPIYFDAVLKSYVFALDGSSADASLKKAPTDLRPALSELVQSLCRAHIFVPHDYDEDTYLNLVRRSVFRGPNIRVLVLHLTDFCNLACRYCFIEGGKKRDYENKHMSSEVARAALSKFATAIQSSHLPKPPSVVFYGGEPLLNFPVLCTALEHIKALQDELRLPRNLDKIVITNGTRVTYEISETLKRHNVSVSVSLDGPAFLHDQNRVYRSGEGSFQDSMRGFSILKEAGLRPTVSCVLSEPSLDHVPEIMHWLLDELGVRALGFNHVSIVPDISQYDAIYESRFADAVIQSHEIVLQYPDVYERRMSRKLNSFLEREIVKADCTGCGEQMAISPDGRIGICQGYMGTGSTFVGDVFDDDFDARSHATFVEWSQRSPLNMPYCHDCPALSVCGGGCPRNAEFTSGSIWEPDIAFCHFAKRSVEWIIWKVYDMALNS